MRLGAYFFAVSLLYWLCVTNHVLEYYAERRLLSFGLGHAVLTASRIALAYFALEPYVRRRWPWRLVSWQRLLTGRFGDPLVGRDVLIGCATGMAVVLMIELISLGPTWLGAPPKPSGYLDENVDFRNPILPLLGPQSVACEFGLRWFFVLFIICSLARREWLGAGIVLVLATVVHILGRPPAVPIAWLVVVGVAITAFVLWVALRCGLLTLIISLSVYFTLKATPLTADLSTWYVWYTVIPAVAVSALAVFGFVISLGDRPLFARWRLLGAETVLFDR